MLSPRGGAVAEGPFFDRMAGAPKGFELVPREPTLDRNGPERDQQLAPEREAVHPLLRIGGNTLAEWIRMEAKMPIQA